MKSMRFVCTVSRMGAYRCRAGGMYAFICAGPCGALSECMREVCFGGCKAV